MLANPINLNRTAINMSPAMFEENYQPANDKGKKNNASVLSGAKTCSKKCRPSRTVPHCFGSPLIASVSAGHATKRAFMLYREDKTKFLPFLFRGRSGDNAGDLRERD
ncbi:hypothetical protein QE152_g33335 [Popillia japonica]|uniref:Uncharacterized protein n=1 Tax=Popillia japonica TaxID=7064 RepID=A0AAW1IXK7_POPJA